jgi:hypothetical protein
MKNRSARGDTVLLTPFFLQEFKYTPYFLLSSRAQCTPYFFIPSTEHYTHYFLFPSSTHIYSLFPSLFNGSIHLIPSIFKYSIYSRFPPFLQGLNILLISFFFQELKYTPYFHLPSRARYTPYFLLLSRAQYMYFLFPSSFKDSNTLPISFFFPRAQYTPYFLHFLTL